MFSIYNKKPTTVKRLLLSNHIPLSREIYMTLHLSRRVLVFTYPEIVIFRNLLEFYCRCHNLFHQFTLVSTSEIKNLKTR